MVVVGLLWDSLWGKKVLIFGGYIVVKRDQTTGVAGSLCGVLAGCAAGDGNGN